MRSAVMKNQMPRLRVPFVERGRTANEAGTDAEDRQIRAGLALAAPPLQREQNLHHEAEQRQQPGDGQQVRECVTE